MIKFLLLVGCIIIYCILLHYTNKYIRKMNIKNNTENNIDVHIQKSDEDNTDIPVVIEQENIDESNDNNITPIFLQNIKTNDNE